MISTSKSMEAEAVTPLLPSSLVIHLHVKEWTGHITLMSYSCPLLISAALDTAITPSIWAAHPAQTTAGLSVCIGTCKPAYAIAADTVARRFPDMRTACKNMSASRKCSTAATLLVVLPPSYNDAAFDVKPAGFRISKVSGFGSPILGGVKVIL